MREAVGRFFAGLSEHGRLTGPPAHLTEQGLSDMAAEFGEVVFAKAVHQVCAVGVAWPGWRVRHPDNWLRQEAEKVRLAASQPVKRPTRPSTLAGGPPMPGDWDYGLEDASP